MLTSCKQKVTLENVSTILTACLVSVSQYPTTFHKSRWPWLAESSMIFCGLPDIQFGNAE